MAILQSIEARLFNPDREELNQVFKGTDRGAKAVVARDKGKSEKDVWPDEVYTQIGASEEAIFDILETMVWRDTLWDRICERELP